MDHSRLHKTAPTMALNDSTNTYDSRQFRNNPFNGNYTGGSVAANPIDHRANSTHFGNGNGVSFQKHMQPSHLPPNPPGFAHQCPNHQSRQRYLPYGNKRTYANTAMQPQALNYSRYNFNLAQSDFENRSVSSELNNNGQSNQNVGHQAYAASTNGTLNVFNRSSSLDNGRSPTGCVTLQISNLDTTIDERVLKQQLINRLKPITTVLSIYFENVSVAKIKLPTVHHARQAIALLHRKKIGHKRITVAQTCESSSMEPSTLRCQVAGLLKDIPNYKLSMYKFRELFQTRFKTSISVTDLYDMKDICTVEKTDDTYITLRPELISSIENSELIECLQHSVPYCTTHFVKSHRGWAEQEIDPLPNVQMPLEQVSTIMYQLLEIHKGDIPIASVVHCIQAELQIALNRDDEGVNFEHLISCVANIQIGPNKFGIKILKWSNMEGNNKDFQEEMAVNNYSKFGNISDSFVQVSREIIDLIKSQPKSTMKFSRFIPAYHNQYGKQCRVADYGYTKLIDLFEALSTDVQVMGDGENRQITLTNKVQMRRFQSDLIRVIRSQPTKSLLLSQLSNCFQNVQGKKFDITDYGVCDIRDFLYGLGNSNVVAINRFPQINDIMISIPKRKQSAIELEKTTIFAGEVVELFRRAPQFTIPFEKFACSYHYQFGYQCRLCDYGVSKLADLMEAISGLVEMEFPNDEDRKICLSQKTGQRIFSEQLNALAKNSGTADLIGLHEILVFHKKEYGYQIQPQTLGFPTMIDCVKALPYIELINHNNLYYIKCHHDNEHFRQKSYAACRILLDANPTEKYLPFGHFVTLFANKYNEALDECIIASMNHAIEIGYVNNTKCVVISAMMQFVLRIINVIEPIGIIRLPELKNMLNITISECFLFGYPNFVSLVQAFPDIFILPASKPINPRAEIELNKHCILTTEGSTNCIYVPILNNTLSSGYESIQNIDERNSPLDSNQSANQLLSQSFNQSSSLLDNLSMVARNGEASIMEVLPTEHRQLPFFPAIHSSFYDSSGEADSSSRNISRSFNRSFEQDLVNSFGNSTEEMIEMYYQPPKPDTPSRVYWLDPVWTLKARTPKLNIHLPDLQLANALPKLDTPTVMSSLAMSHRKLSDNKENVMFSIGAGLKNIQSN